MTGYSNYKNLLSRGCLCSIIRHQIAKNNKQNVHFYKEIEISGFKEMMMMICSNNTVFEFVSHYMGIMDYSVF